MTDKKQIHIAGKISSSQEVVAVIDDCRQVIDEINSEDQ